MKTQIVSFHCVLKDKMDRVISETFNREVITRADGEGDQLKGLIERMQDLKQGERRRIVLSAKEAYGYYDPGLVIEVSRRTFKDGEILAPGQQIRVLADDGRARDYRVVSVAGDLVVLDGNHPLAGQDLVFDITATEAREASEEELREALPPSKPGRLLH